MRISDKIIKLRKQNGWSQEELAEKIGVSRQAVSKWESDQALPDIDKILLLSEVFGVTTDYLLKDAVEGTASKEEPSSSVRRVTVTEAKDYIIERSTSAVKIAIGTFLCILSPLTLIVFGSASDLRIVSVSENFACAVGIIVLLAVVAAACVLFVQCGIKNDMWKFLEDDGFKLDDAAVSLVNKQRSEYRAQYIRSNITGTCICVLSPTPLLIGAFIGSEFLCVLMLAATMVIAGIGAMFFIICGVKWAAFERLLCVGRADKVGGQNKNSLSSVVLSVYWLLVTAGYLAWSFITNSWDTTWIVWPVAGVLSAAIKTVLAAVCDRKED